MIGYDSESCLNVAMAYAHRENAVEEDGTWIGWMEATALEPERDTVVVEDHPKIALLQVSICGIASILNPSLKPPKLRCSYHCSALLSTENTCNVSEVYEVGFSHFRSDYYPASVPCQMFLASCSPC